MARITRKQIDLLKTAVEMAADWRGNTPPEDLEEFDQFIADCRVGLSVVRAMRKETTESPTPAYRPAWGEE